MGQDFKGNHLKLMEDTYKNMEDLIIKAFAYVNAKMGEGALTRDMLH